MELAVKEDIRSRPAAGDGAVAKRDSVAGAGAAQLQRQIEVMRRQSKAHEDIGVRRVETKLGTNPRSVFGQALLRVTQTSTQSTVGVGSSTAPRPDVITEVASPIKVAATSAVGRLGLPVRGSPPMAGGSEPATPGRTVRRSNGLSASPRMAAQMLRSVAALPGVKAGGLMDRMSRLRRQTPRIVGPSTKRVRLEPSRILVNEQAISEAEEGEEEKDFLIPEEMPQPQVTRAVTAHSGTISPRAIIRRDGDVRGRKMLGNLLGHLTSAKARLAEDFAADRPRGSKSEPNRGDAVKKGRRVEPRETKSRTRGGTSLKKGKKPERKLAAEKAKDDEAKRLRIERGIKYKETVLLQRWLEDHYKNMMNFIRTRSEPTIFYLPAKHTSGTKKLLQETTSTIQKKVLSLASHFQERQEEDAASSSDES